MDSDGKAGCETEIEPRSGLSGTAIQEQVDCILASPDFHATDKLRDFLRFIVGKEREGRGQRSKAYTIALSPRGPSWFHAGHVIDHLLRHDYEHALTVTRTYYMASERSRRH